MKPLLKIVALEKQYDKNLVFTSLSFNVSEKSIFWIKGISIIGANRSGIFLHLMPIFSTIMAIVIFNEQFMFYHLIGAIFIILGLLLSNKKKQYA